MSVQSLDNEDILNPNLRYLVGGWLVTLVVAFGFLLQKFWEMAGAYEWYFVILLMQVQ